MGSNNVIRNVWLAGRAYELTEIWIWQKTFFINLGTRYIYNGNLIHFQWYTDMCNLVLTLTSVSVLVSYCDNNNNNNEYY